MQLTPLGSNQTQVEFDCGTQVFFSYKTPVAAFIPGMGYVKTSTKWSVTTTKHINIWLDGVTAKKVSQEFLNDCPHLLPAAV